MSKQTGISIETLKAIKKAETTTNEKRRKNAEYVEEQQGKKDLQQLVQLANQIRFHFQMKRVNTLPLNALVQ
jgi:hypothetical protein